MLSARMDRSVQWKGTALRSVKCSNAFLIDMIGYRPYRPNRNRAAASLDVAGNLMLKAAAAADAAGSRSLLPAGDETMLANNCLNSCLSIAELVISQAAPAGSEYVHAAIGRAGDCQRAQAAGVSYYCWCRFCSLIFLFLSIY